MKRIVPLILFLLASCATTKELHVQEFSLPEGKAKFCFIGDMGVANAIQDKVSQMLAKENCHSVHMLGDLIYPSGMTGLQDPELEEKFLSYYRELKAPINLILGNHDHRGNAIAWIELGQQDPNINFPHFYYLQNWGGLCVVHLDSNYYKLLIDFFRAQRQSGWLSSQFDYLNQKCSTKIALTHHPYKSRGPNHGNATGLMKDFHQSYILGKFDYLISGHEHVLSDEGEVKGTRLFISGAGGNYTKGEDAGYLVLEVEKRDGKIQQVEPSWRRISTK